MFVRRNHCECEVLGFGVRVVFVRCDACARDVIKRTFQGKGGRMWGWEGERFLPVRAAAHRRHACTCRACIGPGGGLSRMLGNTIPTSSVYPTRSVFNAVMPFTNRRGNVYILNTNQTKAASHWLTGTNSV